MAFSMEGRWPFDGRHFDFSRYNHVATPSSGRALCALLCQGGQAVRQVQGALVLQQQLPEKGLGAGPQVLVCAAAAATRHGAAATAAQVRKEGWFAGVARCSEGWRLGAEAVDSWRCGFEVQAGVETTGAVLSQVELTGANWR